MSKPLQTYYQATKYLGQLVGKDVDFLHKTSCMDIITRRAIAGIEAITLLSKRDGNVEETKELEEIKEVLAFFGFASWLRDTVTDMALRHIETDKREEWETDTTEIQDSTNDADSSK